MKSGWLCPRFSMICCECISRSNRGARRRTPCYPRGMRYLVLVLLLAACPRSKQSDTVVETKELTPKEVTVATRGAIEQGRQGYEVRSIDALERLYSHDPDIVLVNDGVTLIGWSSVDGMLKDR